MTTQKKTVSAKTKATIKKPTTRKKKAPTKKHIVDAKLNRVMDEQTGVTASGPHTFRKKKSFPWWGLIAFVLLVVFGGIILYEQNNDFRSNLNRMINATGLVKFEDAQKPADSDASVPFTMKLTIVYNKENSVMKESIDQYLKNLESNLIKTTVDPTWLDKNDEGGKALIAKLDSKYLPIFITQESIKDHPQYQLFGAAIRQINGEYVFQSEGMEYLTVPPVEGERYLGLPPEQAKVVIIEYASFSCSYCKVMQPILERVLTTFSDDVSLVIKHFDRGGIDILLAQAAECAGDQGKYSQMQDGLYNKQADFFAAMQHPEDPQTAIYDLLKAVAVEAGANGDSVLTCVQNGTYIEAIEKTSIEGREYGVMGTPSFFINSRFLGGATDENTFVKLIEEELNK